jgi:hypothetical protein
MIIEKLPLDIAEKPRDGECLVDRYWVIDDEGLYWYALNEKARAWSPQCNANEAIAKSLQEKLYPDARVEQVHLVFVGRWDENTGFNPFPKETP